MASLLLRKSMFSNHLRTLHRSAPVFTVPLAFTTQKEDFNKVLPEVMNSLMSSTKLTKLPEVRNWLKHMLEYSTSGGKQSRGVGVPFAYRTLETPELFTEDKLHTAHVLGWCLEIAYILNIDDIIDVSTTRRGKPCWYLQPNVGTSAVNDISLIYQCLMEVLKINFEKAPFYIEVIELINEAVMYTSIGQYLDHISSYNKEKNNIDLFTMDRYNTIAVYKTGFYSFRLPMLVGLLLVTNGKERDTKKLSEIGLEFGKFLQIQNDYKDIYYEESIYGKAGSDIQEGKISWLAITALERGSDAQRSIFKEFYGSKDPEHVKRIKQLYDELQIDEEYQKYERSFYDGILGQVYALPSKRETQYFLDIFDAIRQKAY